MPHYLPHPIEKAQAMNLKNWEDFNRFGVNRLEPRATFQNFATSAAAIAARCAPSPRTRSLDGTWKFSYAANVFDAAADLKGAVSELDGSDQYFTIRYRTATLTFHISQLAAVMEEFRR